MIARTHDISAITALGIVFLMLPPETMTLATVILAVLANLIGGVVPDIDQPTAPLWKNLPIGKYFGKLFGKLLGGHRFLTHSIIGLLLFGFLFHLLLNFLKPVMPTVNTDIVFWAFMIGMLSHLVMDTFTKEGVPWLLPLPVKFGIPPVASWRITTGKWVELWVIFPVLVIFNVWLYFHYYHIIFDFFKHYVTY